MSHALKPLTYKDFKAFRQDGSLHPDIIKAFLIKETVYAEDVMHGQITISDYRNLKLICDPEVLEAIKKSARVDCLISVQFRRIGHYAIAKLYVPKATKTQGEIK